MYKSGTVCDSLFMYKYCTIFYTPPPPNTAWFLDTSSSTNLIPFVVPSSSTDTVRFVVPSSSTNPVRFVDPPSSTNSYKSIHKSGTVCHSPFSSHLQIGQGLSFHFHVQIHHSLSFHSHVQIGAVCWSLLMYKSVTVCWPPPHVQIHHGLFPRCIVRDKKGHALHVVSWERRQTRWSSTSHVVSNVKWNSL